MAIQTKREKKIEQMLDRPVALAKTAIDALVSLEAELRVVLPFLHDAIINGKDELREENRADMSAVIDPAFAVAMDLFTTKFPELHAIYNDDPDIYASNLATFLENNPTVLAQAEAKLA